MFIPTEIGRYRVLNRIGQGSVGVLYRALDPLLDREVAIKRLIADFGISGNDAREQFFLEAKAAARLQHRNIVTIFDYGEEEDAGFIVLELLRGESLAARLKRSPRLTVNEALDIVIEICTGLDFAHRRGVVHRDVKPANVWMTEERAVKLLDFGIAKLITPHGSNVGEVVGTIAYLAPERLNGAGDERADIFSAAAVLFELVTGRRPFDGGSPTGTAHRLLNETAPLASDIDANVPPVLTGALARALDRDPAKRFQTAADFALELENINVFLAPNDEPTERITRTAFAPAKAPAIADDTAVEPTLTPPRTTPRPSPVATPAVPRTTWAAVAAASVVVAVVGLWTLTRPAADAVTTSALPPQKVTPATATVNLVSEPSGANIRVDGQDTGFLTPYVLTFADRATHLVEVSKTGYVTVAKPVSAADYAAGILQLGLKPIGPVRSNRLVAVAGGNYEFEVWDARSRLSAAKARHDLRVSRGQQIRLVSREIFLNRDVRSDELTLGQVTTPALGLLRVLVPVSAPYGGCPVFVDGAYFGDVGRQREIVSGPHLVELRCGTDVKIMPAAVRVFVRPGSSPTDLAVE